MVPVATYNSSARQARVRLWPGLTPGVFFAAPDSKPQFPLGGSDVVLFARARHALWHGVHAAALKPGDEVLTPAYHCGAEVEALVRAGLAIRFYEAGERLEPDQAELETLLGPRTRALLLIHYFGFPQDLARWRTWCERVGLLLIEDCAHAIHASRDGHAIGSVGDVAVFSFGKTIPLPDGAALVARATTAAGGKRNRSVVPLLKRHAQWAMARFARLDATLERFEREYTDDIELGNPAVRPSRATPFLLRRLARPDVTERRRAHYRVLLEAAKDRVPPAFAELPAGASPLIFPLKTTGDPSVFRRLEHARVEARPFWPIVHPSLPADQFPGAAEWRRAFVALPVHQELRSADLERIATALG
jgi:dTDP-4-amino-4,6-dideoxygalactose transaminase